MTFRHLTIVIVYSILIVGVMQERIVEKAGSYIKSVFLLSFEKLKAFLTVADTRGAKGSASFPPPPIIFTGALVLKSVSTRELSFQEVEPLLIILYNLYTSII